MLLVCGTSINSRSESHIQILLLVRLGNIDERLVYELMRCVQVESDKDEGSTCDHGCVQKQRINIQYVLSFVCLCRSLWMEHGYK